MTADLCINHESGGGAGKNPLSARVACETGKVILKGGEATVEADGGEKRSRAQINALKASGGGPFSAGRRGMGECTRHSHSSGSLEDTGRSVGERRRRSVAHGSQGQQPSQKRGTIAISDERRGDQAGLSFGSNHGSSASGTAGFLPSLLLNDSALALQTALVALLQLQKQDQDGVQKEPVIPRRNLMCTAFLKTGACNNPERCNYAHNMVELQKKLELRKTSLCKYWLKGKCENEDCNFAHGEHELQSTEGVYKTTICKYWKQGACYSGNSCRHAHGEADLRPEKLPPHLERKRNQKVKQQWKSGGGGVAFPSSEAQPGGGPRTKQQPLYPSVPTRFPCSQGASFDGIKASEAFERPGSVVLGIGDFTRENSGGSDSLLRSGNLNATRGSSLAEEETRVGMAWRSGGSGCGSVASDASTISVPLFPAVQSIGGPGGLVFVPPPGLAMQKDFGGVAVGRSASLTAAFPQKDDAELDERSGNLISSRCPYVSESVLRTLSESVAGLTVDETAAGRARAASGDPLPHQVGRGCGHMEAPEAVGEEKHGLITATTLSSLSVGFFAGMEDESSAPSKRDSETASPALSSASR
ncbi:zinc finger (CCCH type) motif-containing protein [Besnoitia besnoiti]|uniref:Zinc finger (CCCH type) motif-containing protein n=1 Tax=Besnoitia besnoiti TaxID=94643 RepID=A0A2A9MGX2_BESBE|nr:zinc finger (CCCH type) motif-containing protein [Besnoitia besnoiti]PFH36404.1 zinc finger (CCCH type) motif-containing protein [Besnoitia besnoiti]